MNCLVTVGTTCFDSLIITANDIAKKNEEDCFTFQISNGIFKPSSGTFFEYSNLIDDVYLKSDLVITHAGAGSIFKLLELGKRFIIVPNLERVDKHQSDISSYMESNNYALVCWCLDDLSDLYNCLKEFKPNKFAKENFFKFDEISDFISQL
ncbi:MULTISPECIES: PssE/Cps14G family polysaccharide biosynthesis glycosyltransferase [Shewanella]|uniref:PssE/Cps14G family polysaccharide biosynthesis glycosyltransferase n=1 Tax=Shewanella TaxID=22 RepID=UPI0004902667|nr:MULTISPECIES: PssE/Cps14G family polysaccharide biosynthesis glycosyltransferase [Shewanella]MDL2195594.1 PssE/Cps14G family polysaccharide biosynthesis glycosyltransferase [Shewanella algae]HEW9976521.1 hypothetical protein [Shewanella algae]